MKKRRGEVRGVSCLKQIGENHCIWRFRLGFYVLLLCLFLGLFSSVSIGGVSNVKVIAEDVNPFPVEPGHDLTVKMRLVNDGSEVAEDIIMELKSGFPFILKAVSQEMDQPQNLCVGCSKDSSYYFTVDNDAVSGMYPIQFEVYTKDRKSKFVEEVNVRVAGVPDVVLQAKPISEDLYSNLNFEVPVTLRNIGTGVARNIKITPKSSGFVPLGGSLSYVEEIAQDSSYDMNLLFAISEDVDPNTYEIPIEIEFLDDSGTKYVQEQGLGLKVLHKAELALQSVKVEDGVLNKGQLESIFLVVENVGFGDAKDVSVEIVGVDGSLGESSVTYVGKIDSDDDRPTVVYTRPANSGTQHVKFLMKYSDDFGAHEVEQEYSFIVESSFNYIWIILGVVVLVLALLVLRWRS